MSNYDWLTTRAPSTAEEREQAVQLMDARDRRGIEDLAFQVMSRTPNKALTRVQS